MYLQARVYIRTALVYLLLALLLGGLILLNQGLQAESRIGTLLPVFYHLLTVGWLTQLIAGVALWMFPAYSRDEPRGDERLGWVAYSALNAGLLLRTLGEPLFMWSGQGGWLLALSAFFQVLAGWTLVVALWPRVKGRPAKQ